MAAVVSAGVPGPNTSPSGVTPSHRSYLTTFSDHPRDGWVPWQVSLQANLYPGRSPVQLPELNLFRIVP